MDTNRRRTGSRGFRRRLGQHFLSDGAAVERVVKAIAPLRGERFFEVGPGRGAITWPLLAAGARVLAVEIDHPHTDWTEREDEAVALSIKELKRIINELEQQMKAAARELQFEQAAAIRDQIYELRGILAEGNGFLPCNPCVVDQLFKNALALRRYFLRQTLRVGLQNILVQNSGGLDAKLLDGAGDECGVYLPNGHMLPP